MSEHVIAEVPQQTKSSALTERQIFIALLSILLAICFFLPWFSVLGQKVSGFDLFKMETTGINGRLLIVIPGVALMSLLTAIGKLEQARGMSILAGCLPLIVLAYFWSQEGSGIFQILGVGAHLSLLLAGLLVLMGLAPTRT